MFCIYLFLINKNFICNCFRHLYLISEGVVPGLLKEINMKLNDIKHIIYNFVVR
jgi:hypothetical protein